MRSRRQKPGRVRRVGVSWRDMLYDGGRLQDRAGRGLRDLYVFTHIMYAYNILQDRNISQTITIRFA